MKTFRQYGLCILLLTISLRLAPNMASPYIDGTRNAAPFTSENARIISEKIVIAPDAPFQTARFYITYTIEVLKPGVQVPLLFVAMDYANGFSLQLDGHSLELKKIPDSVTDTRHKPWSDFSSIFSDGTTGQAGPTVVVHWESHVGYVYPLHELHYFEADLSAGLHTVEVNYTATPTVERNHWIRKYSLDYSLSPAEKWKGFGKLRIELLTNGLPMTLNLGQPTEQNDSLSIWQFDKLPGDMIKVYYQPPVLWYARWLIWLGPGMLSLLVLLPFAALHIFWCRRLKQQRPDKKHLAARLSGIMLVPLLYCILYIKSYDWIDNSIGIHAGRDHGYTIFIIVFYPLYLGIYLIIMLLANWLLNRIQKVKTGLP